MDSSAYGFTPDLMQLLLVTNLYPPQGTRWLWAKHGGLRLGPDAARASRTGALRRRILFRRQHKRTLGEKVVRCLSLKGSFMRLSFIKTGTLPIH